MPEISVIIPVYNNEQYLDKCIRSVIIQNFTDFEIICINDGSTDGSGSQCDQWALLDKRVKVLHTANRGLSVARNFGVEKAVGRYIYFLDSDDFIGPQSLHILFNSIKRTSADVVIGNSQMVYPDNGKILYNAAILTEKTITGTEDITKEFLKYNIPVIAWNKLYKKSFLIRNNLRFREKLLHEDELWSLEWVTKAGKVHICSQITYNYRQHSNSITKNFSSKNVESFHIIHKEYYDYFIKEKKFEIKSLISHRIINSYKHNILLRGLDIDDSYIYWKKNYDRLSDFNIPVRYIIMRFNDLWLTYLLQSLPAKFSFILYKMIFKKV